VAYFSLCINHLIILIPMNNFVSLGVYVINEFKEAANSARLLLAKPESRISLAELFF